MSTQQTDHVSIPAADGPGSIEVLEIESGRSVVSIAADLGEGRDGVIVNLGVSGAFRLAQALMQRYAELVLDG